MSERNILHRSLGAQRVQYDKSLSHLIPTLYIGLGGTGKNVLMRFRKALFDEYKSVRPQSCRFMLIDGNEQEKDHADGETDDAMMPAKFAAEKGEFVGCSISENVYQATLNRVEMEHDRRYKDWIHPHFRTLIPPSAVVNGAGTYRQAGRFQFFINYSRIREQIRTHLSEMFHFASQSKQEVLPGVKGEIDPRRLEVVIVTSLAGGTGSGMFLDMAYLVQDILGNAKSRDPGDDRIEALKDISAHVTLMAFMPTVFTRQVPGLARRFQQNAYAALLEMEHYCTCRTEDSLEERDGEQHVPASSVGFHVNWTKPDGEDRLIRRRPWDTCYLIDDINDRQPGRLRDAEEMYQMAADYLFLDFGSSPFAIAKRSARSNHSQLMDNLIQSCVMAEVDLQGKRELVEVFDNLYGSTFSSFGLAEIQIDREKINRAASYRLALGILERHWVNRSDRFAESDYVTWTRVDLQDGAAPVNGQGIVSFSPDNLWQELFRREGEDWLRLITTTLESIAASGDPHLLAKKFDEFDRQLARGTGSERSALRRTMDLRFEELVGRGELIGELRSRLRLLGRARFLQSGTAPTLELLRIYEDFFRACAARTHKWLDELRSLPSNTGLLARLRDAQNVPFPSKGIAVRIEFARALAEATRVFPLRCRAEAITYLEKVYAELRAFTGSEQKAVDVIHKSLRTEFSELQEFLESIRDRVNELYRHFSQHSGSDRKISLLPAWTDADYDREIDRALILNPDVGPNRELPGPDWERAEEAIIRQLYRGTGGQTFLDLVDGWLLECRRNHDFKEVIAERVAHACRIVLGKGLDLTNFANGNVVEFLAAQPESNRRMYAKKLIEAAAPYFPAGDVSRVQDFRLFCRNILGRSNGEGPKSREMVEKFDAMVQQAAVAGAKDHLMEGIHDREELEPTRVALVRELSGFPLSLYSRIPDLESAYLDRALNDKRKTCHIRYRDTYEDLPDIMLVEDEEYRAIREFVDYVFRGLCLRFIERDTDGVFCVRMISPTIGEDVRPLGMRLNRIVKHACNSSDVREYLKRRWQKWSLEIATPKHFAVLYNAMQQSRDYIRALHRPTVSGQRQKPVPALNCIHRVLTSVELDLKKTDDGRKLFEVLRDRDHERDNERIIQKWRSEEFPVICRHIAEACLALPGGDLVPIYQIDEQKLDAVDLLCGEGDTIATPTN